MADNYGSHHAKLTKERAHELGEWSAQLLNPDRDIWVPVDYTEIIVLTKSFHACSELMQTTHRVRPHSAVLTHVEREQTAVERS